MRTEKRPRQYADEIRRLPSREAQREAFARVPEHLQPLTRAHLRDAAQERDRVAAARRAKLARGAA